MKTFLLVLCALVALNQCTADLDADWAKFKNEYKRNYSAAEDKSHKAIFAKTLAKITNHQENFKLGKVSYEMGLNNFSDMDDVEFRKKYADDVPFSTVFGRASRARNVTSRSVPPASVDWIKYGYSNPVLNQGGCGCCYTFSSIAALEAQYFIKHKKLILLSHQELMDCSRPYGNNGCHGGGYQKNNYKYMLENGGVGFAKDNAYTGTDRTCKKTEPRITISKFFEIPSGDEEALKQAVADIGPIPIDMDSSLPEFKSYKTGVFYNALCRTNNLSHSILVVGYGTTDKGEDYWLVRNSWGTNWGEKGYIRMARNRKNHCGVATRAVYPIVD